MKVCADRIDRIIVSYLSYCKQFLLSFLSNVNIRLLYRSLQGISKNSHSEEQKEFRRTSPLFTIGSQSLRYNGKSDE